jgi:protein-S-isoprenylcysteine O-methyltransferase Ste14
MKGQGSWIKKVAAGGGILFFFVMAFEVMIMISPFAFFFYSVFSPFFNFLGQHAATRWLTSFFLPHMILPPTFFLQAVRVAGSVLFVVGLFSFIVGALQVYLGKIFKWGIAARGLYAYIRHPQYLSLGLWGVGMAILWPRFIVLVTLSLMFVLYYFLAKDEERRMLQQYGASYQEYLDRTGMFVPRALERPFVALLNRACPTTAVKYLAVPVLIVALVLGSGWLLRQITLRSLPLQTQDHLTLVPILPEDSRWESGVLRDLVSQAAAGEIPFLKGDRDYLGYVMPPDYIMQGMIADTGGHFHLFKQHHTVALIVDWVLHPFAHLRRPPAVQMAAMHHVDPKMARRHHCPVGLDHSQLDCNTCPVRRVILVEIGREGAKHLSGSQLLAPGTVRTPVGFIDLDARSGKLLNVKSVARGTAWKDVPTPEI